MFRYAAMMIREITAVEPLLCVRRAALVVNIGHTWGPKTDNPQAMPFPHTHWGTKPHKTAPSIPPMGDKHMHFRHSSYGRQSLMKLLPLEGFLQSHEQSYIAGREQRSATA